MVSNWLARLSHSAQVQGLIPGSKILVWSLHILPMTAWVLSGYFGFLPLSPKIQHSKLFLGVSVSVNVCALRLFRLYPTYCTKTPTCP